MLLPNLETDILQKHQCVNYYLPNVCSAIGAVNIFQLDPYTLSTMFEWVRRHVYPFIDLKKLHLFIILRPNKVHSTLTLNFLPILRRDEALCSPKNV